MNRLLVVDTAIKRAMKGEIDLFEQAKKVVDSLNEAESHIFEIKNYYEERKEYIQNFKNAILMVMGVSSEKFKRKFVFEQQIWLNISDMIIWLYAAESTLLRVEKLEMMKEENGEENVVEDLRLYKNILNVYLYDSASKIRKSGEDAINSFAEGKEQELLINALSKFTKVAPVNVKEARLAIADKLIDDNAYKFGYY
jgi:hypothetical protein